MILIISTNMATQEIKLDQKIDSTDMNVKYDKVDGFKYMVQKVVNDDQMKHVLNSIKNWNAKRQISKANANDIKSIVSDKN